MLDMTALKDARYSLATLAAISIVAMGLGAAGLVPALLAYVVAIYGWIGVALASVACVSIQLWTATRRAAPTPRP